MPLFYCCLKLSINHTHLFKAFRIITKQETKPHNHNHTNSMGHWITRFAREADLQWTTFGMSFTRVSLKKKTIFICMPCFYDGRYKKKSTVTMNFFTIQKFQSRLLQITFCIVICGGKNHLLLIFRNASIRHTSLYCASQVPHFLQNGDLWPPCIDTIFPTAFARFMSLSHFGNSCN